MQSPFTANYNEVLRKIETIDPIAYGKSRNYLNGAVTRLSPYISRGVISTRQVLENISQRGYKLPQIESFVKELCWRDYFQRVGQHKNLNEDIRQPQLPVLHRQMPSSVINAATGIQGIDAAIQELYQTGYMHNHCRMYTASVVCNVGQAHWLQPARWLYYHLLDGDWASNACSWQWVAGANSSKKYFANQENINRYTGTSQSGTFLDTSYENLAAMPVPESLLPTESLQLQTQLPTATPISIDISLPTFIYNYHNLDPLWHKNEPGNRILLLDPAFFAQYPVSSNCINFMLALAQNIPGLQVFVGSFQELVSQCDVSNIHYKEHPFNQGYQGTEEPRDWIVPEVTGYFPSFFAYWKKVERQLYKYH
ncbi:MAG: FAD-binding domain-containing protein [Sphingomonadales bacterium]|jgi:deoxyribodipyrimidine photo-lyase